MIKKPTSDHEDLPSLPMGYFVRNHHRSRRCCTALQPLRGSRAQLCFRPPEQPQSRGQTPVPVLLQGYSGELTDHYLKHHIGKTALPKTRQPIQCHFKCRWQNLQVLPRGNSMLAGAECSQCLPGSKEVPSDCMEDM